MPRLTTRKVDWTRKHDHYVGPLTRAGLLAALDDKQRQLLATLETIDVDAMIDWDGTPFSLPCLRGSSCNTRRSITASEASTPRSPGSKRRSAGARHGACEDRQDRSRPLGCRRWRCSASSPASCNCKRSLATSGTLFRARTTHFTARICLGRPMGHPECGGQPTRFHHGLLV
jgi:hypothetical protein